MRIVFAGTPEAAVPSLRVLAASDHEIAAVVTRPDAPTGRKRRLTPSAVADAAADLGAPVLKTARLDDDATRQIEQLRPELGVIVAYGGLVREPLLSVPTHGWINLHFSLLPRWRGAAPVQHALIAGDEVTGVSIFGLVPELDAGALYGVREYVVGDEATAGEVLRDLAGMGAELLRDVVADIAAGRARTRPQSGEATSAPKLDQEDGRIRWEEPAEAILARVRGTTPEPGAFTMAGGGRVKILSARAHASEVWLRPGEFAGAGRDVLVGTGTSAILLEQVQPAGKTSMKAGDWWRGLRLPELVADS
ncbi:methionyl-tRNA formyltransferase [Microbacterium sp. LRZ72]|uniref:methionyl-tRNA formyltransferase n=1 Tax=Microbacterium sp. LRZ72 TaxID=2942481 RepID=UPI0029A46CAB|nr:methionyl-tRNA formyltransferase [Microbacterium sp. LRZ72]MDX2375397.1 methionyl-tRNA formyltransferase [Microbacterium sp. LRZ72]